MYALLIFKSRYLYIAQPNIYSVGPTQCLVQCIDISIYLHTAHLNNWTYLVVCCGWWPRIMDNFGGSNEQHLMWSVQWLRLPTQHSPNLTHVVCDSQSGVSSWVGLIRTQLISLELSIDKCYTDSRRTLHWQTVVIILTWKIVPNQMN